MEGVGKLGLGRGVVWVMGILCCGGGFGCWLCWFCFVGWCVGCCFVGGFFCVGDVFCFCGGVVGFIVFEKDFIFGGELFFLG